MATTGIRAGLAPEFSDLREGDTAVLERVITNEAIQTFAQLSGDWNPLHVDDEFARDTEFQRPVAHGMLVASLVSTLIGMQLPGPGALWAEQSFRWLSPLFAGDSVRVVLRVTHKSNGSRTLKVSVEATNQHGVKVMSGDGTVMMLERRRSRGSQPMSENVVLVTGGSRGIGAAIVRAFAEAGAGVAAGYYADCEAAGELCEAMNGQGGRTMAVQLDVREPESVLAAVDRISQEFGRPVSVLVNAAGLPPDPKPFDALVWSDFRNAMDVHVGGAFHASQAVVPKMIAADGGSIINIGSIYTEDIPPPHWTAFVAAKAALKAMTRSLAAEYGPKGIRVNMVSPGPTTDSTALSDRLKKVQAMQSPLRQLCAPEDVAAVVLFLCSKAGAAITGCELPVCGGSRM